MNSVSNEDNKDQSEEETGGRVIERTILEMAAELGYYQNRPAEHEQTASTSKEGGYQGYFIRFR